MAASRKPGFHKTIDKAAAMLDQKIGGHVGSECVVNQNKNRFEKTSLTNFFFQLKQAEVFEDIEIFEIEQISVVKNVIYRQRNAYSGMVEVDNSSLIFRSHWGQDGLVSNLLSKLRLQLFSLHWITLHLNPKQPGYTNTTPLCVFKTKTNKFDYQQIKREQKPY